MIQDLSKYTDFLIKHDITPSQFLLLYILFLDGETQTNGTKFYPNSGTAIANIYKLVHHQKKIKKDHPGYFGWNKGDLEHLQDKGFISDSSKLNDHPDQWYVTPKFVSAIFALESDFDDFWEAYPAFANNFEDVRQGMIPLRAVDKEEIYRIYKKKIVNRVDHNHLMEGLEYALEQGEVKMRIDKFLSSEIYKAFLERKRKTGLEELNERYTIATNE